MKLRMVPLTGSILVAISALAFAVAQQPQTLWSPEAAAKQAEIDAARRAEQELAKSLEQVRARRERLEKDTGQRRNEDDIPQLEDQGARIVNGVATIEYPGVGALVKGSNSRTARSWCTGTLIGCRTFLTANHCVEGDRTPSNYQVYFQNVGFVGVESISAQHRDYAFPHADLAVLRLAESTEALPVTSINRTFNVPDRTPGTLVGFGRTGGLARDPGVKRRGTVQTAKCDRTETSLLCWDFRAPVGLPGNDSNTCNADSGGPLFVQAPGPSASRLLAGVTSGGTRRDCLAGDHSYDVDVRQFADWIAGHAGTDLGAAQCGSRASVGTAAVKVLSGGGRLEIGQAQDYRFPVPAGTTLLVIALNGTDEPATNLNLFVKRGAAATASNNDCAWNEAGNYAACSFASPAAGDWFVRVDQQGQTRAEFQVVATMYPVANP
jgi:hypothetical protein